MDLQAIQNRIEMPGKENIKKDQAAEWLKSYVNSPKYKERLANFYQYPSYVQNQRAGILRGTKFTEAPEGSTKYYSTSNEVTISQPQLDRLKADRQEALAHELGHAVNQNSLNRAAALSPAESRYIMQRNKVMRPEAIEGLIQASKETGRGLSNIMGGEMHDVQPAENLSDIHSLRFLLKQRGIHDASKEDVTPEMLRKAANDPVIRRSFTWKRLKELFGDKELQEIMNKVAVNNNMKSNMA